MTTLREAAMRQALEALEYHVEQTRPIDNTSEAIAALKAALAEEAMQRLTDVQQEIMESEIKTDKAEPVAWRTKNATPPGGYVVFQQYPSAVADLGGEIEPLYAVPPQRKPLSGLEVERLLEQSMGSLPAARRLVRAIERAHGIGGEA